MSNWWFMARPPAALCFCLALTWHIISARGKAITTDRKGRHGGDPGQANPIKRSLNNIPIVTVFDITNFLVSPSRLAYFQTGEGILFLPDDVLASKLVYCLALRIDGGL